METKRTVFILTDGTQGTQKLAERIADAVSGHRVTIKTGQDFIGTDLLPADICFLGCEKPAPLSFKYFEDLLRHINLAGRPCGLFSPSSPEAIQYLADLARDSELAVGSKPLFDSEAGMVKLWVTDLFKQIK